MIQEQNAPQKTSPFLEDEADHAPAVTKYPPKQKPASRVLVFLMAAVLSALCFMSGRYVRENTTLFMNDKTPEGYLPLTEYALFDPTTGKPVQNVRGFTYEDRYAYDYSSTQYITSRNIANGSSWEDFVEAYGDCTAESILATPELKITGNKAKETFWDTSLTVREFDERYIQSGQIDLRYYNLSILFEVYTDGYNVHYDIESSLESQDAYNNQPQILHLGKETPVEGVFSLSFLIEPNKRDGVLVPEVSGISSGFTKLNQQ